MSNIYDEFYEQYMPELSSRIHEFPSWAKNVPNHRKKKPYIAYSSGKSGIQYYSEYTSRGYLGGNNKGFIVGIYIDGANYKHKLDYFKQFESRLNNSLVWLDTGKAGRIFYRLDGIIENKVEWKNIIEWQIGKLIKTMNEFKPYITDFDSDVKIDFQGIIDGEGSWRKEERIVRNQILYGPPGTGKTYNTINRALEIIDGKVPESRSEAKKRFESLRNAGQIEFVTFHQSYGYEEFVEGIKANTVDGNISYDVEDGVYKKLCKIAEIDEESFEDKLDKYLELLAVSYRTLTTVTGVEFNIQLSEQGISTSTNHSFSKKKLIDINNNILKSNPDSTYGEFIVYDINHNTDVKKEELKNYILIIDEINRGNISKIFGELITLIEPSKRIGAEEEIRLRLPYSNDEFGVPSNLYIIGTMNTADRSIALMDTALRRRFEFVEMMPNADILDFEVEGVNLKLLLNKINARVEYLYDRDHTIGHAYFMELNAKSSLDELNAVMRNRIIPLLQEYFYDDWEKIKLVLNEGFIKRIPLKAEKIFENIDDEYIEEDKFLYTIKEDFEQESYLRLCQNS